MRLLFDPICYFNMEFDHTTIVSAKPVYVRKQFGYIGHAANTFSVEQAVSIIDYIGQKFDSDDCLPFAVSLVEGEELVSIAEDNGEFAAGDILAECLKELEGYNVLVCVTKKVKGCFVTDMVQGQKHRVIKEAADAAIECLLKKLRGSNSVGSTISEGTSKPSDTVILKATKTLTPRVEGDYQL